MRHSAEKATTRTEKEKREKNSLAFLLLISFSLLILFTHDQRNLKCKQFTRAHALFSKTWGKISSYENIPPLNFVIGLLCKKKKNNNSMFSLPTPLSVDAIFVT